MSSPNPNTTPSPVPPGPQVGVLDSVVKEIADNSDFLTEANVKTLYAALPARDKTTIADPNDEQAQVRAVIASMLRITRKLETQSATADVGELTKILSSTRGLMDFLMKHSERLDEKDRLFKIETAIETALNELGNDELTANFKRILYKSLVKVS